MGILNKATYAQERMESAKIQEESDLENLLNQIDKYSNTIDWEKIFEKASKSPEQTKTEAIGIGTDGKVVNLDNWEFTLYEGSYALATENVLNSTESKAGYLGDFTESGEIIGEIPQYIKDIDDEKFISVTNIRGLFFECEDLKYAPEIPSTVTNMRGTFSKCTNLIKISEISQSVTDMQLTFNKCSNLNQKITIPNSVVNMRGAFFQCSSLKYVPDISDNVVMLDKAFYQTNIEEMPELEEGVGNLKGTFANRTNLKKQQEFQQQ